MLKNLKYEFLIHVHTDGMNISSLTSDCRSNEVIKYIIDIFRRIEKVWLRKFLNVLNGFSNRKWNANIV